ncbi:hypothetical protein TRFO_02788 [Tritrichomonas foetus]|uniref:Leucine Rich Repeat family protein n=1 Tax=Tritrichomonas foetus TaxID=1144522 RepID=A0A1J4L0L5_9EUKA|nr:hypothetical protein TRFO_02788 [Tritrichomonas foetus]|eukprot:OHT15484.1 hypothetical protein TRFO_02788 [Tritrichomonas foetus]
MVNQSINDSNREMKKPRQSTKHEKIYSDRNNNLKYKLSVQRPSLGSTGLLNLRGLNIESLEALVPQPHLKILDITKTTIKSLASLPPQPLLTKIIADESKLETLAGLSRHPKLKEISFKKTPLNLKPNIRIACLIVTGNHLSRINSKTIEKIERLDASKYPIVAKYLLEADWQLEVPVPSMEHFHKLSREEKFKENVPNDPSIYRLPNVLIDIHDESEKEKLLSSSILRQNEDDEIDEEINEQDKLDADLEKELVEKLASVGIRVNQGKECRKEIIDAISNLVKLVQIFNTCKETVSDHRDEEKEENNEL